MYEGYLQHDAQEVLQCILAYIQEACDTIKKELESNPDEKPGESEQITRVETDGLMLTQEEEENSDGLSGKRKSDTEVGNAKKKPKSQSKPKKGDEESRPFTRSKRKSTSDLAGNSASDQTEVVQKGKEEKEGGSNTEEEKNEGTAKDTNKRKKRAKLNWLKPSGKQPSIFSKFRSMGRISSYVGDRGDSKDQDTSSSEQPQDKTTPKSEKTIQNQTAPKTEGNNRLVENLMTQSILCQKLNANLIWRIAAAVSFKVVTNL